MKEAPRTGEFPKSKVALSEMVDCDCEYDAKIRRRVADHHGAWDRNIGEDRELRKRTGLAAIPSRKPRGAIQLRSA